MRNTVRGLLLAAAAATVLLGSACSGDDPVAPASSASARPSASATNGLPAPGVVDPAIVTKMDDKTVSFTDAQFLSSETGNRTIAALPGQQHQHSAPLASNATFFAASGCGSSGPPKVDVKGLGAIVCTATQFREQVAGQPNLAPAITFNQQGQITKMAARYHP